MENGGGATLDFVCADLRCPVCGKRLPDPCAIDVQIKFARRPSLRHFRVGDRLDAVGDLSAAYFALRRRPESRTLRVIETWSCPNCASAFLWARLTVEDGVLTEVEAVDLTDVVLAETDFITQEVAYLAPSERMATLAELPSADLRLELAQLDAAWREERSTRRALQDVATR